MEQTILVTYSEIALKGGNRSMFEKRLVGHIERALTATPARVHRGPGRIFITSVDEGVITAARRALPYIFGIHTFALARVVGHDYQEIAEAAKQLLAEQSFTNGTLAVKTRRSRKSSPLSSSEVNNLVGRQLQTEYPQLGVDLDQPDLTVVVEVRDRATYVYTDRDVQTGPGGLPTGVSGRGLALLSGGLDSPVACWTAMKRGLVMDAVYFHSAPHTGEKAREKVFDLARVLARWQGGTMRIYSLPLTAVQEEITRQAPEKYWTVLFRRSMRRIAEAIRRPEQGRGGRKDGYDLLVTGDSLAQVASQTPENLSVIETVGSQLTIRPLIGCDKQETISRAKRIGTYDISIRPYQDCCSVFTPSRPATKARLTEVVKAEELCSQLAALEERALESAGVYVVTPTSIQEKGVD